MATQNKKALHAYLEPETKTHLEAVSAQHGVSMSALIEATIRNLNPDADNETITQARAIDTGRRKKQGFGANQGHGANQ